MAELADAADSKSADLRVLGVRLPLPAPAPDLATVNRLHGDVMLFFLPADAGVFFGVPIFVHTSNSADPGVLPSLGWLSDTLRLVRRLVRVGMQR